MKKILSIFCGIFIFSCAQNPKQISCNYPATSYVPQPHSYYQAPQSPPSYYNPIYDYDQTYVAPRYYGTSHQVQKPETMPALNY